MTHQYRQALLAALVECNGQQMHACNLAHDTGQPDLAEAIRHAGMSTMELIKMVVRIPIEPEQVQVTS